MSSEHVLVEDFWLQPILNLKDQVILEGKKAANHLNSRHLMDAQPTTYLLTALLCTGVPWILKV